MNKDYLDLREGNKREERESSSSGIPEIKPRRINWQGVQHAVQ
jgi:hypothetical protein